MKKNILIGSLIVMIVTLAFSLLYTTLVTYEKIVEVSNQLVYLQDTNTVMQRELETVVNSLDEKIQQEASLVENYKIELESVDFKKGEYQIFVSVVPKEYTDQTKLSVFFGAEEYPLAKDGFSYKGNVRLMWEDSYNGNVTLLFSDGKKRNTEVLTGYQDIQEQFEHIIEANCDEDFLYRGGKLRYNGEVSYVLESRGNFQFSTFELVIANGEEILYKEDLLAENEDEEPVSSAINPFTGEVEDTETESEEPEEPEEPIEHIPVYGIDGTRAIQFEKELPIGGKIRGYLRAVSVEGYTFEYEFVKGTLAEGMDFEYLKKELVIDAKGGRLEW